MLCHLNGLRAERRGTVKNLLYRLGLFSNISSIDIICVILLSINSSDTCTTICNKSGICPGRSNGFEYTSHTSALGHNRIRILNMMLAYIKYR